MADSPAGATAADTLYAPFTEGKEGPCTFLGMSTARRGPFTSLAPTDATGQKRTVLPFRWTSVVGEPGRQLFDVPAAAAEPVNDLPSPRPDVGARSKAPSSAETPPVRDAPSVAAAVGHFLAESDAERRYLEAELEAANARLARAEGLFQLRQRQVEVEIGAMTLAAHAEIAELEEAHDGRVRRIRDDARAEASQLVKTARDRANSMKQSAAELAQLVNHDCDVVHLKSLPLDPS